jgi:hypothetical protein
VLLASYAMALGFLLYNDYERQSVCVNINYVTELNAIAARILKTENPIEMQKHGRLF